MREDKETDASNCAFEGGCACGAVRYMLAEAPYDTGGGATAGSASMYPARVMAFLPRYRALRPKTRGQPDGQTEAD